VPENANDASAPIWRSANTDVATVDYKGEITGVNSGLTNVICNINGIERSVKVEVWLTRPFKGPHVLSAAAPLTLLAVDFDFGGQNNAYYDNNNSNQGGNNYRQINGDNLSGAQPDIGGDIAVGWTGGGEWLIYTIEVKDAGKYQIEMDGAGTGSSNIRLELLNGYENHLGGYWGNWSTLVKYTFPNTGGWSTWQWYTVPTQVEFPAGVHKLRYYWESASTNFRNLRFTHSSKIVVPVDPAEELANILGAAGKN
jgi:hypothetical protein